MAALSFRVHSACTTGRISFMYSMKAFSGFLMCGSFFFGETPSYNKVSVIKWIKTYRMSATPPYRPGGEGLVVCRTRV